MYISIEQAIEIYDELILAKEDKLPFRENVAEIYVFKFYQLLILADFHLFVVVETDSANLD